MAGLASYKRKVAAGSTETVTARGMLVVLRQCQSALDLSTIQNQVSGKGGEQYSLTLRKGEKWFAAQEFDGVVLANNADFDQTVEVLIGYGDYQEPPPNVATSDAIFVGPQQLVVEGSDPVLVADENPRRSRIIIKCDAANVADVVFINPDTSGAFPIGAGESLTLQTRGAVYVQPAMNGAGVGAGPTYSQAESEIDLTSVAGDAFYYIEEVYNEAV